MKITLTALIVLLSLSFLAPAQNFTAILEEVVTPASPVGQSIHVRDMIYMKDGNLAIDVMRGLPTPHTMRNVWKSNGDFMISYSATVDNPFAVKSTYKIPLPLVILPTVESKCLTYADGFKAPYETFSSEMVGEIPTIKTVVHDSGNTITMWRAPSLACVIIQQEVEFPLGGKSVKTLVHLDKTTPIPDSIFDPAATEMKPSDGRAAYLSWAAKQSGQPCSNCAVIATPADAAWLKQHAH
jgi:hypothetical protein